MVGFMLKGFKRAFQTLNPSKLVMARSFAVLPVVAPRVTSARSTRGCGHRHLSVRSCEIQLISAKGLAQALQAGSCQTHIAGVR